MCPSEAQGSRNPACTASHEHVLDAVQRDGSYLRFATQCRGDREIVLAAVRQYGWALQFADEECQNDREIVLAAVQMHWAALLFAAETQRGDREIVLTAVQENWRALQHAADRCRNDRDLVLIAMEQDAMSFVYAGDALLEDRTFATDIRRQFYLLRITLLSGRSTIVASPTHRVEYTEAIIRRCCERLCLDYIGRERLLHGSEWVPKGGKLNQWPVSPICGEVADYQLLRE
mmetsp:Transcript_63368/g.117861  ORF Transcript_63368/g.117861 Transcript_63368/m.117861 type:complete len:232 (+) Transcript_63368:30-725(+)